MNEKKTVDPKDVQPAANQKNGKEHEGEKAPKGHQDELAQLKEQNKHLHDKFLRLAADFDNARKRWEKDREEVVKYGTYKILKDLIVFVDEMEHAIEAMKKQDSAAHNATFVEGVTMTCNKLKDLLISEGVKEMNPAGEKFDPYKHEILAQEVVDGICEPVITEVFQKGYLYNERLLRTAKVKVSIPKSTTEAESQQEPQQEKTTTDGQSGMNTIDEQI